MRTLKIFFTSDLHGYFFSTTYRDKEEKPIGLFKCANQFKKDGNTLIIDGGDILQGSAFSYYCYKELKSSKLIARIMNLCGYDFITIGNHDFNYGLNYLKEYISTLDATCVCQNVVNSYGKSPYSYVIKTLENGLKIGIMGMVTDYVNIWERKEHFGDLQVKDVLSTIRESFYEMKSQVDITIGVYHGGFEANLMTREVISSSSENVAYSICNEFSFDLLLTGHQHMEIQGQYVNGTFVVQPMENGKEFHYILVEEKEGELSISSKCKKADGRCLPIGVTTFGTIEHTIQLWLDETVGFLKEELRSEEKLTMAMKGSKIASLINQIQLYYSSAEISATSLANELTGFSKRVTRRNIISSYPYPNTLVIIQMKGKDIKEALEKSAEYFEVKDDGKIGISAKFQYPKIEHYNYDYFEGITYHLNPYKKMGNRVVEVMYHGKPMEDNRCYLVCVNNYRASGAGNYSMYLKGKRVREINIDIVELILEYFEQHSDIEITKQDQIVL